MLPSHRPRQLLVGNPDWVTQAYISSTPRRGVALMCACACVCVCMRVCHFDNIVVVVLKGVC